MNLAVDTSEAIKGSARTHRPSEMLHPPQKKHFQKSFSSLHQSSDVVLAEMVSGKEEEFLQEAAATTMIQESGKQPSPVHQMELRSECSGIHQSLMMQRDQPALALLELSAPMIEDLKTVYFNQRSSLSQTIAMDLSPGIQEENISDPKDFFNFQELPLTPPPFEESGRHNMEMRSQCSGVHDSLMNPPEPFHHFPWPATTTVPVSPVSPGIFLPYLTPESSFEDVFIPLDEVPTFPLLPLPIMELRSHCSGVHQSLMPPFLFQTP